MKNHLLAGIVAITTLSSCSSTPPINEEATKQVQQKLDKIVLHGYLIREQDKFLLGPHLSSEKSASSDMLSIDSWHFNGKTLFPLFDSERFECSLAEDNCERYENIDSPFLKVNGTDSDYGDTYKKRVADGKKPGISAGEVAMTGVATVIVGPAVALVGGPLILLGGTANLISHGSVWSHNWVEFDHDTFYAETVTAITAKHGSLENYIDYMASASTAFEELTEKRTSLANEWQQNYLIKSEAISKYQPLTLSEIDTFNFSIPAYGDIGSVITRINLEMDDFFASSSLALEKEYETLLVKAKAHYVKHQKEAFASAKSSSSMRQFINRYAGLDEAGLLESAKKKLNSLTEKEQEIAFNKIRTVHDARVFIHTYGRNDVANLVPNVKAKIEKWELRIKNEKIEKRRVALAKLEKWREQLQVGDLTFCGRVIQAKYPMIQIALSNPLQGFSDTIWLEKDDVFEAWSGCNNRNNQLSPLNHPLS
ncbi:hypothetical protein D1814_12415 [Alteromonas sp. BL110]|uniref:hypothetical protein n=1 Tax=Alteromonas sp. BL110 TaxID=1714845 RepID=UPI000E4965EB|nr:hypothetical protein [Alteromonas sp. BL110]AXT39422.1 hypothetical protein D1814_12415 [Alteromonas sp. BL110]RKM82092.1 hypothetical protein D7031_07135 [Alteromonas sp. BL110]